MGGNDGEGRCWTEADSAHPELHSQSLTGGCLDQIAFLI